MSGARRFELQRRLGEGSFGTVYLADMVSNGGFRTRVALKVLNARWGPESDASRRLRDEARVLGRLEHHHIVRVYDLVRLRGCWAVVMEPLRGPDVEQVIARLRDEGRTLGARASLDLVGQVASALHAALTDRFGGSAPLGVVHRDIKPSNLILTTDGVVKVLDFGIAGSNLDEREASTSRIGFGSIPFMSPERLRGETATAAGDVFALGAVLFELLTGLPYGRVPIENERIAEHHAQRFTRLRDALAEELFVEPELATGVVALLDEMLAADPDARLPVADVRARCTSLARRLPGDTLVEFAQAELPEMTAELALGSTSAEGVLSEESSGGPAQPAAVSHSPTLVVPDHLGADWEGDADAFSAAPRVESAQPRDHRLRVAALVAAGLLVLVGGGLLMQSRAPVDGPPETAAAVQDVTSTTPASAITVAEVDAEPPPPALPEAGELEAPQGEAHDLVAVAAPQVSGASASPARPAGSTLKIVDRAAPAAGSAAAPAAGTAAARTAPPTEPPPTEPAANDPAASGSAAEPAPTIRMIKVVAPDATHVEARCGEREGVGSSSLVVRDAPVGACTVEVQANGQAYRTTVQVDRPQALTCAVADELLACR